MPVLIDQDGNMLAGEVPVQTVVTIADFSTTTNSVGAFVVSDDTTKVCVGLIFTVGNEYTYYQYDQRSFILFGMNGTKKTNTAVSGRAILVSKTIG